VTESFRISATVGIGWGRMDLDKVDVQEPTRSYTVRKRSGVFVEVPLGLLLAYDIIPQWLAVQAEADVAPLLMQSGSLHGSPPYTDSAGTLQFAGPMPTLTHSVSVLFGLSLAL